MLIENAQPIQCCKECGSSHNTGDNIEICNFCHRHKAHYNNLKQYHLSPHDVNACDDCMIFIHNEKKRFLLEKQVKEQVIIP